MGWSGKGGEMTQTLYAHMNIIKKEKKRKSGLSSPLEVKKLYSMIIFLVTSVA
jgi:hypothetical protein